MKTICVIAGDQTHDVVLQPGTTARDVLKEVGLPSDFCLSPRDGQMFGKDEVVFDDVRDGEKLFATPQASVAGCSG